jgi:hypothetical protein
MSSVRVNLSVPIQIDRVLKEICNQTGQSKASLVQEALTWQLPRLRQLLASLVGHGEVEVLPSAAKTLSRPHTPTPAPALVSHDNPEMPVNRAERRRAEREQRRNRS